MTAAPSVYDVQDRVTDLRTELIHEQCRPQVAKGTAEGGDRGFLAVGTHRVRLQRLVSERSPAKKSRCK